MLRPKNPKNEHSRLRALASYKIVDTPAEKAFDALTAATARILNVPIALVSLVDESRQWFKSHHGLEETETPRDISFCGHVVGDNAVLVVEDASQDERFATNPLVGGHPNVIFYAGMPLLTPDGYVLGTLCAIDHSPKQVTEDDLTLLSMLADQVVAQLELRKRNLELEERDAKLNLYRKLFEQNRDLLGTTGETLRFEVLNPAWQRSLGWSSEEIRTHPPSELIHADDLEYTHGEITRILRNPSSTANFENRYRHKDGHWVRLAWSATAENDVVFFSARDVTEHWHRQHQLEEKEKELSESVLQLQALFEGMQEGAVLQHASGQIIACNQAAEKILGLTRDQMMQRTSTDPRWRSIHENGQAFPGEEHPAMVTLRTGIAQKNVPMGIHHPDGMLTWITVNSQPLRKRGEAMPYGVVSTFRDVTEEKIAFAEKEELRDRIARQEKLVTTGTLAAGIGHEINNPLTFIIANVQFALEEMDNIAGASPSGRLADICEALTEAQQGAERIRKIVKGLRSFAREKSELSPTDVQAAIEISLHMAMHEVRQVANLETDLMVTAPVLADESRLSQVIVNLIVNAAQAFERSSPSENKILVRADNGANDTVIIEVIDNGPGIAAEVKERIFDPFFTTKPIGRGTGLGLSISHSIVTLLRGTISAHSQEEGGACFRIVLPAATGPLPSLPPSSRRPGSESRLLVIDDEPAAVRAVARLLRDKHYVHGETSPHRALTLLLSGAHFDAILCDLMMPGLNGADLHRAVAECHPRIAERFVFFTGGATAPSIQQYIENAGNRCLEKPVDAKSLTSALKAAAKKAPRHSLLEQSNE